jgi:hypothetical protein
VEDSKAHFHHSLPHMRWAPSSPKHANGAYVIMLELRLAITRNGSYGWNRMELTSCKEQQEKLKSKFRAEQRK